MASVHFFLSNLLVFFIAPRYQKEDAETIALFQLITM